MSQPPAPLQFHLRPAEASSSSRTHLSRCALRAGLTCPAGVAESWAGSLLLLASGEEPLLGGVSTCISPGGLEDGGGAGEEEEDTGRAERQKERMMEGSSVRGWTVEKPTEVTFRPVLRFRVQEVLGSVEDRRTLEQGSQTQS